MPIGISLEGTTADKRRAQCRTMFNRLVAELHKELYGYPGWTKAQIQEHLMTVVRSSIKYGYFLEHKPYATSLQSIFTQAELVIGGVASIRCIDKTRPRSQQEFRVVDDPPSLDWPYRESLKGPIRHKAMSASGPSIKSPVVYRYKGAVLIAAWVNLKLMTEHLLGQKHPL